MANGELPLTIPDSPRTVSYVMSVKKKDLIGMARALYEELNTLREKESFLEGELVKSFGRAGLDECGEDCSFYRKRKCSSLFFGMKCILLISKGVTENRVTERLGYEHKGQLLFDMKIASTIDEFKIRRQIREELKKVVKEMEKVKEEIFKYGRSASLEK